MIEVLFVLVLLVGITLGIIVGKAIWDGAETLKDGTYYRVVKKEPSAIDSLDLTENRTALEAQIAKSKDVMEANQDFPFAVTSKPRHVPWSIRKKELEQEARQKRRQLESFREPQ